MTENITLAEAISQRDQARAEVERLRDGWALSEEQHDETYDEMSRRAEAAEAREEALRERLEALADEWRHLSRFGGSGLWLDHADALAALAAQPTPPAAPHAEDGV